MKIIPQEVPTECVEIAMSAKPDLFRPGKNEEVMEWLQDMAIPSEPLESYAVHSVLTQDQRDLLVGDLSLPTPDAYPSLKEHRVSRFGILQLAMGMRHGQPFGLEVQRNGVLTQDIFPKNGLFDRINSGLSAAPFDFHTDQAFSHDPTERPEIVSLACVRNKERVITGVLSVDRLVELLPPSVTEELEGAQFRFYTGREVEGRKPDVGPIFWETDGVMKARLGGDTTGVSPDADAALVEMRKAMEHMASEGEPLILMPGDVLTFDNERSIHYRTGFEPVAEPSERRWLTKVYIHMSGQQQI